MTKVTYTPLENGDPIETSITAMVSDGVSEVVHFSAGKAVDVPDTLFIDGILTKVSVDKDGNEVTKGVAKKIKLVEHLRGNPYFSVEGSKQAVSPAKSKVQPRLPQTPEQYRGWALQWFKTCETPTELHDRWEAEADMRDRLSVHDDGEVVRYLRPFYDAHFDELKKAAA